MGTGAPKGVLRLPYTTLRAAWPALRNPANLKKETPLSTKQFYWCFTNALSREESDDVYDRYYIPGTGRPFFQAGLANFNPNALTKVDYANARRAPLLLMTGTEDRICPPSVHRSNFKQQQKARPVVGRDRPPLVSVEPRQVAGAGIERVAAAFDPHATVEHDDP